MIDKITPQERREALDPLQPRDDAEGITETQLPQLLASLACDDVAVSPRDDRVTLQRIAHDIYADSFPARLERLAIVNVWSGGLGAFTVGVRLCAPSREEGGNGPEIAYGDVEMEFSPRNVTNIHLLNLGPVDLPEEGAYTIEILLDGWVVHGYDVLVLRSVSPISPLPKEPSEGVLLNEQD